MKMLIDGREVDASNGKTIDVTCPVNGSLVGTVPAATAQDMDEALAASLKGQKAWQAIPDRKSVV